MSRRRLLILISALHICIFVLTVIFIVVRINNSGDDLPTQTQTEIADKKTEDKETEVETTTETQIEKATTEIETETPVENETKTEIESTKETSTETQTQPQYSFVNTTEHHNLNIRQKPTASSAIIGKVPIGGIGDVISIEDEQWALIEYNGIQGYCSMEYLQIEEK